MKLFSHFFGGGIWEVRTSALPTCKAGLVTFCRGVYLTIRFFVQNRCLVHASALTYFTMLSIVPIAALLLGVAKGYGFEKILRDKVQSSFPGQEEIANWVIHFADNALQHATSGIVAGIGVIILIWTAVNLLTNIERAFNEVWGVRKGRSLLRKISDYVTLLILCPILLTVLITSQAFILTHFQDFAASLPFSETWNRLFLIMTKILPFVMAWLLFTFLYAFIPNIHVKFRAAAAAGAFTGFFYLVAQGIYIYAQKKLTGYNAIYGSFAALPLFLIWIQFSWSLILLGAQIAFTAQNVKAYELAPDDQPVSTETYVVCAIQVTARLAKAFQDQTGAMTASQLSEQLIIPICLTRKLLFDLCECGVLCRVMSDDQRFFENYQLAIPLEKVTLSDVLQRLISTGRDITLSSGQNEIRREFRKVWDILRESPVNQLLTPHKKDNGIL